MDRLDALFDRHLDGTLAPEEQAELATLLANPEAQRRWRELTCLEGKLLEEHQAAPATARRPATRRRRRRRAAGSPNVLAWIAAAGTVAAALAMAVGLSRPAPKPAVVPPVEVARQAPEPDPVPVPEPPLPKPEPPLTKEPPTFVNQPAPTPPPPAPAPEPEPMPEPVPAPKPPPPRTVTAVAVAQIEQVTGEVHLAGKGRAVAGQALTAGAVLETRGVKSSAVLVFPDGTRLELGGNARLGEVVDHPAKAATLERGSLTASVVKQERPMTVRTPGAEARVLGTRFVLDAAEAETVLEVTEGKVRVARLSDGAAAEVTARHFAVVAPGPVPQARPVPALPVVLSFTLIDAATGLPVPGFDPLAEGAEIRLGAVRARLNIRANVMPRRVGSVRFDMDGSEVRVEQGVTGTLYTLAGDANGRFNAWTPLPGRHVLRATPYTEPGAKGQAGAALTVSFRVTE